MDQTLIIETVDRYNLIKDAAYRYVRDHPECMGKDSWLQNAMSESDMNIQTNSDGLRIWGHAYTSQTWDHEYFDFTIPYSVIEV